MVGLGGDDLLDEILKVMSDREACATELTGDEIGVTLEQGLDGVFLTARFKWSQMSACLRQIFQPLEIQDFDPRTFGLNETCIPHFAQNP